MLRPILSRLTYANVIATLALFVALGGTAAAGAHVWVTGADVRDGSLTGADVARGSLSAKKLKPGTITGATVRDGSLRVADFDPADLQKLVGPAGPQGPAGPAGTKGDEGKTGDPGAAGIVRDSATGSTAANYVDDDVLLSHAVPLAGGWLVWGQLDVTNTSANDDNFNCGFFVNGQGFGGGGDYLNAGQTKHLNVVGFGPADPSQPVQLWCERGGGGGTFDVANVSANFAKIM